MHQHAAAATAYVPQQRPKRELYVARAVLGMRRLTVSVLRVDSQGHGGECPLPRVAWHVSLVSAFRGPWRLMRVVSGPVDQGTETQRYEGQNVHTCKQSDSCMLSLKYESFEPRIERRLDRRRARVRAGQDEGDVRVCTSVRAYVRAESLLAQAESGTEL